MELSVAYPREFPHYEVVTSNLDPARGLSLLLRRKRGDQTGEQAENQSQSSVVLLKSETIAAPQKNMLKPLHSPSKQLCHVTNTCHGQAGGEIENDGSRVPAGVGRTVNELVIDVPPHPAVCKVIPVQRVPLITRPPKFTLFNRASTTESCPIQEGEETCLRDASINLVEEDRGTKRAKLRNDASIVPPKFDTLAVTLDTSLSDHTDSKVSKTNESASCSTLPVISSNHLAFHHHLSCCTETPLLKSRPEVAKLWESYNRQMSEYLKLAQQRTTALQDIDKLEMLKLSVARDPERFIKKLKRGELVFPWR